MINFNELIEHHFSKSLSRFTASAIYFLIGIGGVIYPLLNFSDAIPHNIALLMIYAIIFILANVGFILPVTLAYIFRTSRWSIVFLFIPPVLTALVAIILWPKESPQVGFLQDALREVTVTISDINPLVTKDNIPLVMEVSSDVHITDALSVIDELWTGLTPQMELGTGKGDQSALYAPHAVSMVFNNKREPASLFARLGSGNYKFIYKVFAAGTKLQNSQICRISTLGDDKSFSFPREENLKLHYFSRIHKSEMASPKISDEEIFYHYLKSETDIKISPAILRKVVATLPACLPD